MNRIILIIAIAFAPAVRAELKLPAIIGDHMVLQQKQTNPIWGWDTPGTKVTVTVDGSGLAQEDTENVTVTGPGVDAALDHIQMAPGEKDELAFDGNGTGYEPKTDPKQTDAPILAVGLTGDSADYGFAFTPVELGGGSKIAMNVDKQAGQLKIDTAGTQGKGTYALAMVRQSEQGQQQFKHDHLQLAGGETAALDYSQFTQAGQSVKLEISGHGQNRSEELTPDQG